VRSGRGVSSGASSSALTFLVWASFRGGGVMPRQYPRGVELTRDFSRELTCAGVPDTTDLGESGLVGEQRGY
jgi:hypothetical protein